MVLEIAEGCALIQDRRMIHFGLKLPVLGFLCLSCSLPISASGPNILLVMVDDMGYSDLGCYGGEIETPNIDGLAAGGLRFTQFYNTGRCWPTRASLLTGFYAQSIRRDLVAGVKSGGRGARPDWAPLLPMRLKGAGYRSYHSGKWHLDGMPLQNGFDRSYYLKDQGRFFSPKLHWEDDEKLPEVPRGSGYYGTTAIVDHAVKCLKEHANLYPDRPFFHYLAFTAPHFPLHALPTDFEKYRHRYKEGWNEVRSKRFQRQLRMGFNFPAMSAPELAVGPPYHFPEAFETLGNGEVNRPLPWASLSQEQQTFQSLKMALHAAMIDRVDQEFGRVLNQLKEMNAWEETLILFLSDNGASAEIMVRADGHDHSAEPGSAASYLCLGPGWSTCANTPFRRHKTWTHEGGISTPLIVHWPSGISDSGALRDMSGHVVDIVPTLLDFALPQQKAATFHGVSLKKAFLQGVAPDRDALWWLHEGNRALQRGDWKISAASGGPWELYYLRDDRIESQDLSGEKPAVLGTLAALWESRWLSFKALATGGRP